MKRIALLLAAVGLGSGCIIESTPNLGSASIYWAFSSDRLPAIGDFTDSAAVICAQAAVDEIEITLTTPAGDVIAPYYYGCDAGYDVPGARFLDLEPGTWDYYIAGYRGSVLVFDDWGSFDAYDGSETIVESRLGALYWDVQVNYTVGSCYPGDTIEFDLYDTARASAVYSTYSGAVNPPVAVPCLASSSMIIPSVAPYVAGVSSGSYEFSQWIQYDASSAVVAYSACVPTWTQPSSASKTVTVDVTASTPGGYCAQ
jgi:hypothetical protein